jgi:hypothetical protein
VRTTLGISEGLRVFRENESQHDLKVLSRQVRETYQCAQETAHDGCVGVSVSRLQNDLPYGLYVEVLIQGTFLLSQKMQLVHAVSPSDLGPPNVNLRRHSVRILSYLEPVSHEVVLVELPGGLEDGGECGWVVVGAGDGADEGVDPEVAGGLGHVVGMHEPDLI